MVGLPATQQSINQQAGQFTVALRDAFQSVIFFNNWLTSSGGQTFLVALGYTSNDAAVLVSTFANLAALGAIYVGGTPGAALNYQQNSNLLWGGL